MNRSTVEEVKARIPIEELVASYVKLEKAGRSFKAKCPFHNEKTASFFISPDRGGYYCFGCGAKGDIFSFVEQFEGLDFKGALKVLAEKAGVPLVVENKAESEKDQLFRVTEEAAAYFESQFDKSKEAQEYVRKRGISPETRKSFRIGWAPEGWRNLLAYLKGRKWSESMIEKAGLAKKNEKGDIYDRFRARIMFPMMDSSGRAVGFTGRILPRLDDGKAAKYLNSPETPLFNKSQILFGLDKAKSEIRRIGYSVLVEGQMDLILSHQVGVKNAVAASGTALTDQAQSRSGAVSNLGMVRRLSPNMIIALDSDQAGRTAAMKAVAATALGMGMSVKIADIRGGKDPADLIVADPRDWEDVLKNAKHVIEFELDNVIKEVLDPHRRPRAIKERVFPFLARIDSEMDKAFYVKQIADKAGLSELAVWEDLRKTKLDPIPDTRYQIPNTATVPVHRLDLVERRMFGLLELMETAKMPAATEFRGEIKKIAGDSYEERLKRIEPIKSDISFEAEAFFGNDQSRWDRHMNELISNFEEDIVNGELIEAMGALKRAEKEGKSSEVNELAKKSQALSVRKAEIAKRRKY
ncbi:MAG: DNA primase [Patescibacteria group bacterium]|nr:DNA primase [Patescibacteria group bacterium]